MRSACASMRGEAWAPPDGLGATCASCRKRSAQRLALDTLTPKRAAAPW